MYDIHCHILPAFDDGAKDLKTALKMARIAVEDGITHLACTPHIYPGLYDNTTTNIQQAVNEFKDQLKEADIPLTLGMGADIQLVSEMATRLKDGSMPTINQSRYVLFEPPHHVAPQHFITSVLNIMSAGYLPVITHPERLSWIETHYDQFIEVARNGAWLQLTAGSLTGRFGERPQYWAEKMLSAGVVHVLATDAHNLQHRPPLLAEGMHAAERIVGKEEAARLVYDRPQSIWNNVPYDQVSRPPGFNQLGELQIADNKGIFNKIKNLFH